MNISIIIPVYNVAPYIEDCLHSVMRQTYAGDMECFIVDDCGTDDSIAIAERMITEYNGSIRFEMLHHDHNRGLSAARNTGMERATGDYIYFLDSDDEITEDCLEKMMAVVMEHPEVELVQGSYEVNGVTYPRKSINPLTYTVSNQEVRECLYLRSQVTSSAWNKLVKRSFIINYHLLFKEGLLYEDFLWQFYSFKYLKNVLCPKSS